MSQLSELRETVIARDRYCVAALLDRSHLCRNKWATIHLPSDLAELTLDHVHDSRGRRQDVPGWCIATCWEANVIEHWESANRTLAQAFVAGVRAAMGLPVEW